MREARFIGVLLSLCLLAAGTVLADPPDAAKLIANAESAGPPSVTQNATIKTHDGQVLRDGTNGWTCYPGVEMIGPMCNRPQWDALLGAMMNKEPFDVKEFSVSYMLAGDAGSLGTSNSDPYANPETAKDRVIEGPHLMILVPDPALLEGLSTNPKDPVYVMWKGTPYAHIMVRIAEAQED